MEKTKNTIMWVMTAFAAIFTFIIGLMMATGKNYAPMLFGVGSIIVGAYMTMEGGWKNFKSFRVSIQKTAGLFHMLSFVFGVLMIYIGITSFWGALEMYSILTFNGWILMIGSLLAVGERFVK